MDISKLQRNASIVQKAILEQEDKLIATKALQIHIPYRYLAAKLATLGKTFHCVAVYAIVVGEYYAVSNVPSPIEFTPVSIVSKVINDEDYYILEFNPGDVISPRTSLLQDDTMCYNLFDEFIGKAKLPWYINYEDVGKVMAMAHYYANLTLADTNTVFELFVASMARNKDDMKQYYREIAKGIDDQYRNPPTILPFRSIIDGTTNTMGKLMGAFFDEGVTSALTYDGGPSGVEDLLRL